MLPSKLYSQEISRMKSHNVLKSTTPFLPSSTLSKGLGRKKRFEETEKPYEKE